VLSPQFENVIVLSEDFYREVTQHSVPNDLDAVKVLASAPAVLDLYMWLSYLPLLQSERIGSDSRSSGQSGW
jgi:Plasmid encoded RepA protein